MAKRPVSLITGRNQAPLSGDDIRRATNTFLGLDPDVQARYVEGERTAFTKARTETGEEYGEIIFGEDIYPGRNLIDPNSALSLEAAAAHELVHYHRWKDKIELDYTTMEHLDEALTSLQAIQRYGYDRQLSSNDIRQLVSDAIQRLQIYIRTLEGAGD